MAISMALRIINFSTNESFTSHLVSHIFETHKEQLPDLSQISIFIPNTIAADQLKNQLICHKKFSALIPPYIGSMNKWIKNNIKSDGLNMQMLIQHLILLVTL